MTRIPIVDLRTNMPPYREIRAEYNQDTITVYQAYSMTIAEAAVQAQCLAASPEFSLQRYTWIKPSWCWMMCVLSLLPTNLNLISPGQVPVGLFLQGQSTSSHSRTTNEALSLPRTPLPCHNHR